MNSKRFFLLVVGLTLIAVILLTVWLNGAADKKGSAVALYRAQLYDMAGVRQPLKQWQHHLLVVQFWAPWCLPCRQSLAALNASQQTILLIALADKPQTAPVLSSYPTHFPVLLGDLETLSLLRRYGDPKIQLPFTLVIRPDDQIGASFIGELSTAQLMALVQTALHAPRNARADIHQKVPEK